MKSNSQSQNTSPDRSLVNLIKHPSLVRHGLNSSASSLAEHDSDAEKGGFRRSLDKLKDRGLQPSRDKDRRRSFDAGRRLSKLVHHRSNRKKTSRPGSGTSGENEAGLGMGADDQSLDSLGRRPSSITSSLLTDDEDTEQSPRPALDTHLSHTGYLTLSSPLLASGTANGNTGSPRPQSQPPSGYNSTGNSLAQSLSHDSGFPDFPKHAPEVDSTNHLRPTTPPKAQSLHNLTTASNASDLPETFVTPPTPDISTSASPADQSPKRKTPFKLGLGNLPVRPTSSSSPAESNAGFRRVISGTHPSSKGFNPLTPAIEEAKTPGGGLEQPATGFFSSVFSATQNAVNQLSTSLATSSTVLGQRARSIAGPGSNERSGSVGGEQVFIPSDERTADTDDSKPPAEPAVATLGSGNLSFSHLGIPDPVMEVKPVASGEISNRSQRSPSIVQRTTFPSLNEQASAAEAVSAAYLDKVPYEKTQPFISEGANDRPASIISGAGSFTETSPPPSIANGVEGVSTKRSNSVRSRLSGHRTRHRKSSVANGGAIAAALSASHATIANPTANVRTTGFPVANHKRNKDFHQLFKSVPEDDFLLEDCSAALQRDILLQGRLYVSEKNICFSSNILGWVTNLVIGFDEIVAIEKRMTAVIFPNAIMIQTQNAKNIFASLIGREATYDLILGVWKSRRQNIKATEVGHAIDNHAGGKDGAVGSSEDSEEESDQYDDEDEDDAQSGSFGTADDSLPSSENGEPAKATPAAKSSPAVAATQSPPRKRSDTGDTTATASTGDDVPGPATHGPTECSDQDKHYEKQLIDTTIPAPLGKIYSMFFGPQSGAVMRKFFIDDQKSNDVQLEDDKKGMGENQKSFSYTYVKNLNASIGPKQTKCIVNQTMDHFDLSKAVSVTCSTQTPDVPSGNVFVTKTKYCIMWGPNNSTRIIASCAIEWSGKSWLKGPIEKGANDGQEKHCKDLVAFFKAQLTSKTGKPSSKGTKTKGSTRRKRSQDEGTNATSTEKNTAVAPAGRSQGFMGMLEAVLGPIGDLFGSMSSSTAILTALLLIMTLLWFRQTFSSSSGTVPGFYSPRYDSSKAMTAQRLAAYEEMWQREESDLWSWLEDRVGMDELGNSATAKTSHHGSGNRHASGSSSGSGTAGASSAGMIQQKRISAESMADREVDEAIRVTEARLHDLKKMLEKGKVKR